MSNERNNSIGSITLLIVVIIAIIAWARVSDTVTNQRIDDFEKRVKIQFDSVFANQDTIKRNVDTLKRGQAVIYDEVKKSNKSFIDKILEIWQ